MKYAILKDTNDIEQLDFTPTLIVGFYQGGYEDSIVDDTRIFKKYFKDIDIIGCSSESNIDLNLPHVDNNNEFPCMYMCLDLRKDAYSLVMYDLNSLPDETLCQNNKYATLLFHTLLENSQLHLEEILSFFKQADHIITSAGAVAGHPDKTKKTSIFLNGKFFSSGETLVCYINQAYYKLTNIAIHDFTPIGKTLEITKVDGYILKELEYQPALKTIESICGTLTEEGIQSYEHPFFVDSKKSYSTENKTLSTIRSIDRSTNTITFYKQLTKGDTLQLAIPLSREEQEIQLRKLKKYSNKNAILFLFTCIAYKGYWGYGMETIYFMHLFKYLNMPLIGCHTFGEIGTLTLGNPSLLQNQTITLAVLNEKKGGEDEVL